MVIAPSTHLVSMTLGDVISGLYMMAWDYMAQRIMYMLGKLAEQPVSNLVKTSPCAEAQWPPPQVLEEHSSNSRRK